MLDVLLLFVFVAVDVVVDIKIAAFFLLTLFLLML